MTDINVLIVEDDLLLQAGIEVIIEEEEGMHVIGKAENGAEALELIKRRKPDIVLMDIQMPVMDGITCVKEIRKLYADLPILILTTFNEEEYIFQGLSYGANGYLLKGIDFTKLVSTIRDAIHHQYVLPSEVAAKVAQYAINNTSFMKERGLRKFFQANEQFTDKEQQIIAMLLNRHSNKEIADKLYLSEGTIKNNVSVIYGKLGVSSWVEAIDLLDRWIREHS